MASIRDFKKEVTYLLGDLIDVVSIWGVTSGKSDSQQADQLLNEIFETYQVFISKINQREQKKNKSYFKGVRKDFEKQVVLLVEKINALQ